MGGKDYQKLINKKNNKTLLKISKKYLDQLR